MTSATSDNPSDWPVVIIDDWDELCSGSPAVDRLRQEFPVTVHTKHMPPEELKEAVAHAAILIPFRERSQIDASIVEAAPALKLIAQTGGGAAHIDKAAVKERGIGIAITPGGSSQSVAELVIGLALASDHRIAAGDRLLHGPDWRPMLGRDLRGQTLALLGFGHTAKPVVHLAQAFGMNVVAWSRSLTQDSVPAGVRVADGLEDLLAVADVLSIHLSLTDATRDFLTEDRLMALKPGALLVNTARGEIVDTEGLIRALDRGHLRGACLDVFSPEPLPADHPLRKRENVVLTPHVGWTTEDTVQRFMDTCESNIRAFIAGKPENLLKL
jgi:D-3-phosphoglycerate dehydrogenase / 2-oxoglutarate reductase